MLDANIGGDPSSYVEKLTVQGMDTSVGQISTYQWAALLLSNGYWTSVRSLRYYAQDTETAAPISWRFAGLKSGSQATVYWPEFSTFLNKSGVSGAGEMTLDFGASGRFVLGIERNIIGFDQGTNMTVGVSLAHNDTKITTRFTGNPGHGGFASLTAHHKINKTVSLFGELFVKKGITLIADRLVLGASRGTHLGLEITF